MTNLDIIAGSNGMVIIDDTNTHTGVINYFIPREDTTLTSCTGVDEENNAIDFKARQNWDGTLKSTDECLIPSGWKITAIKLATGSVKVF